MRAFELMMTAMALLLGWGCVTSATAPAARVDQSAAEERRETIDRGNGLVEFAELPSPVSMTVAGGSEGANSRVGAATPGSPAAIGPDAMGPRAMGPGALDPSATLPGEPHDFGAGARATDPRVNSGGGSGNGKPVLERAAGNGDDIVARRLRKAAEAEADPELRRKLWEEYVNYKKNAGTP